MFNLLDYLPGARKRWLGVLVLAIALPLGIWKAAAYYPSKSYVNLMLGAVPVEGVRESGFHYQEYVGDEPFRWTNGFARLLVPVSAKEPPQRLWLSVGVLRPKVTPVRFQVLVDETMVFDGKLSSSRSEMPLDLASHSFSKQAVIELRSETFKPKGVMDGGKNLDPRELGVQVWGIMLQRDEKP